MKDRENIGIANKEKVAYGFFIGIFYLPWPIIKVKVKVMHIFSVNISQTEKYRQTLLLPTNRKSHESVQSACLRLILARSKGHSQDLEHFDWNYV